MKLDALVLKRFDELTAKGEAIGKTKTFKFTGTNGERYYEVHSPELKGWAVSVLNLLQRVMGESSAHHKRFEGLFDGYDGYEESFIALRSVLAAAKEDYEGGYLFNLRGLVKAEVLTDAIEQATALLDAGYKDPACVVTGIALELALKELATRNSLTVGKLDKMNADVCKAGLYNVAKQKQITAWADLRNKAAHGEWTAYSDADVRDMLTGVERFLADFL